MHGYTVETHNSLNVRISRGVQSNTSTCLMIRRQSFTCCIQLTMLISGYAKLEPALGGVGGAGQYSCTMRYVGSS